MSLYRFASWNVNSLNVRLPQVLDWLQASAPDALVLQETKMTDEAFPKAAIEAAGYDARFAGQPKYNGVALLAKRERLALRGNAILGLPGWPDDQRRFAAATLAPADGGDPVRFCGCYVPNGMAVGSSKYLYKLDWLSVLDKTVRAMLRETPRLIVGGDFNIAPEDEDVFDPAERAEGILCSPPERAAYRRLLSAGLTDSFRLFEQPPRSFSMWDYRQRAFEKNNGFRIDLLLVSDALKDAVRSSSIDKSPRKNEQPSDHAPVVVEVDL